MESPRPCDWNITSCGRWVGLRAHFHNGEKPLPGWLSPEQARSIAVSLIEFAHEADKAIANEESAKMVGIAK